MTETTMTKAGGRPRGATNVVLWVLQVLAAALFVYSGLQKLAADPMVVAGFEQMGLGVAGMYVIGVLELAGAVGLLLPGVAGFAASCLVALMVGATIATLVMMGLSPLLAIPVVTLVVVAVIAWARRAGTAKFLSLVLRG